MISPSTCTRGLGVLEVNYSDYSLLDQGFPGWFSYSDTLKLPAAPDPDRVGYGQPYAGVDLRTEVGTVRLKQDFGSNWHLVAGILNQNEARRWAELPPMATTGSSALRIQRRRAAIAEATPRTPASV